MPMPHAFGYGTTPPLPRYIDTDAHAFAVTSRPAIAGDDPTATTPAESAVPSGMQAAAQGFRAVQYAPADDEYVPTMEDDTTTRLEHNRPGRTNVRQVYGQDGDPQAGNPGEAQTGDLIAGRVDTRAVQVLAPADDITYPDRIRAGGTSSDSTRRATNTIAFTERPFDQLIAQRNLDKIEMPAPMAAPPISYAPLQSAVPYAGGAQGTRMRPQSRAWPNTVRDTPSAWDDSYVAEDSSALAPTTAASVGWRAT